MKPLAVNLSSMKKIAGDKHSSTFQHKDGHQMVIAHSALPALQKKQIEQLPIHKADGGDLRIDKSQTEKNKPVQTKGPLGGDVNDPYKVTVKTYAEGSDDAPVGEEDDDEAAPESTEKIETPPESPQGSEQNPQTAPQAVPETVPVAQVGAPTSNIEQAISQGKKGIQQQADVASQLAKSRADIDNKDLQDRQALAAQFADNQKLFDAHRQEVLDLYKNQQINPNHYMENMSTPGRVATAIGLFLGGWGKNGNPAQQFLNAQIDRDIEAQKANVDKSKTLLGENEKYFQDKQVAENATRASLNDIYSHQMQQAVDKLGTAQAQAQGNIGLSNFAIQSNGAIQQAQMRKTLMDHVAEGGQGEGTTAGMWANAGYLSPQEAQKEDAAIQAGKNATGQVRDVYAQLAKQQTFLNRYVPGAGHPIESADKVSALNAQLDNIVLGADVAQRLNPVTIKQQLEPFHVNVRDSADVVASKAQGVLNLIKQSHAGLTPFMTQHAPASLPNYSIPKTALMEGQSGTRRNGQRVTVQNGNVVPSGNPNKMTGVASAGQ
jgi:hypothetical protein